MSSERSWQRPRRRTTALSAVVGRSGSVTAAVPGSASRPRQRSRSPRSRAASCCTALLPANRRRGNPRAVTDVLTALAGVAAGQPAVRPPGPGQYQYTESVSRGLAELAYGRRPFWVSYLVSRQIWIGWNGSGRIAQTSSDPRFVTPRDRAAWGADGRPRPFAGGWGQPVGPHRLKLGTGNE